MVTSNITLTNARILYRNFSGKPSQYNTKGNRNFCVIIDDPNLVEQLQEDGWNIRYLTPKDPMEEPKAYLSVKVAFPEEGSNRRPPKILLINSSGSRILNENTVHMLDWAEIENIDMVLRPYNYNVGGKVGVKAYLKSLYVTVVEDELEKKYSAMESSALSSVIDGSDSDDFPF